MAPAPFVIVLLGGIAVVPPFVSAGDGEPLVRFQMLGPGSTFNTVYELEVDRGRYQDLLEEAGYFTADAQDLRRPEVLEQLDAVMDLPHWEIDVYRSESETVQVKVPDRYVGRFHPELGEIPYVRAAWHLLGEFEGSWNRSEKVEP